MIYIAEAKQLNEYINYKNLLRTFYQNLIEYEEIIPPKTRGFILYLHNKCSSLVDEILQKNDFKIYKIEEDDNLTALKVFNLLKNNLKKDIDNPLWTFLITNGFINVVNLEQLKNLYKIIELNVEEVRLEMDDFGRLKKLESNQRIEKALEKVEKSFKRNFPTGIYRISKEKIGDWEFYIFSISRFGICESLLENWKNMINKKLRLIKVVDIEICWYNGDVENMALQLKQQEEIIKEEVNK